MEDTSTPPAQGRFSNSDLVYLASGFARILWSLPLGLLLFTGALDFMWTTYFRLPSYVAAALLYYWGLTALQRVEVPNRAWAKQLRLAFALAFLLIYFAPFVYWWTRQPHANHFLINVFALLLCISWILWTINRLAEQMATHLADRTFVIESRLCAGTVLLFMILPISVYFVYALWMNVRYDTPLFIMVDNLRYMAHAPWVYALCLLPLTLSMTIAWKCKQRALILLRDGPTDP